MEILILIALFVAAILMSTGKKTNRHSSYSSNRKSKPRPNKTKQVKQYEFNPKFFKTFEGKSHVIDGDKDIGAELISRGLARDIPVFTGGNTKSLKQVQVAEG